MKRPLFTCLLMILSFVCLHGQKTGGYRLSIDTETTYQSLSATSVIEELGSKYKDFEWNSVNFIGDTGIKIPSCNSKKTKTISLGFDFPYAGKIFKGLVINANGILYLGQDSLSPGFSSPIKDNACENTNYTLYCCPSSSSAQIGTYKVDENDRTSISYGRLSSSTETSFVVEYKNILIRNISGYPVKDTVTDTATFQIILNSTGDIRFHFHKLTYSGKDTYYKYEVGIKGQTQQKNNSNFYDYAAVSSTTSWTEVLKYTQTSGYSIQNALSLSKSIAPPSGLMYTFTIPDPCIKPEAPQSIQVSRVSAFSATASLPHFEEETKDATMLLLGKKGSQFEIVDGTDYLLKDSIGEVKILKINASIDGENLSNLESATEYELFAINYNDFCSNGPIYSNITSSAFKTLLDAPISVQIKAQDTTSIILETTARNNYQVLICISALDQTSLLTIPSDIAVGDVLSNGDKVIYKGDAGEFVYTNAESGQGYYFNVYSIYESETGFEYSSSRISTSGRTISFLPLYFDFNSFSSSSAQAEFTSLFKNVNNSDLSCYRFNKPLNSLAYFEAQIKASKSDSSDLILPPVILGQGKHRLVFQKAFLSPPRNYMSPPGKYQLTSSDSLLVQIGTNLNAEDFQTIFVINNENYTENTDAYSKNYIAIDGYKGEKIYVRFVYYTKGKNYSRLTDFKVEEYLDCETPIDVQISHDSIEHDHAYVDWTNVEGLGEPSSFNIQYLINDQWSEITSSLTKPALLENLPAGSLLKVRVQANCKTDGKSFWSIPSASFRTKYTMPYFTNFSELKEFDNLSRWKAILMYNSILTNTPMDILHGGGGILKKAQDVMIPWRAQKDNPAVAIPFENKTGFFICSPEIYLEDSISKKVLRFDMSINDKINMNALSEKMPENISVFVLITKQAFVFDSSQIVAHFGKGSEYRLESLDSLHVEIDITKFSGEIQFAFYTEYSSDTFLYRTRAFFDNFSIDYACKEATNLVAENIRRTTANLSWESSGETGVLTYHIKGNSHIEDTITLENSVKTYHLSGLDEGTSYVWYVENVCDKNTSSAKVSSEFTTYVCDTITNSRITFNEKYMVTLSWEGKGTAYKLRYREIGSNLWDTLSVDTESIDITGLKAGTRYEYAIQSLCSLEDTDKISQWTQSKNFRTLFLTCHTPTEFKVHEVYWNKVVFTWVCDAKNIQMKFSKEDGSDVFNFRFGSHDTCSVTELSPNTSYKAVIRAVCADGDESEWTDTVRFTTLDVAQCLAPTNLTAELLSSTSARLSWTPETNHEAFHLCFREIQKKWDTVRFLYTPSHTLRDLKTNTIYQWRVQGVCEKYLYSEWSLAREFSCVSIEKATQSDLTVFGHHHQIYIMNPSALNIEKVEVFSINGQMIFSSEVHVKDHLIIPMDKKENILVIRVYFKQNILSYKILLK